jgi:hypothetical protein
MSNQSGSIYKITVMCNGIQSSDHYYDHAIEAVEAWHKFSDSGDTEGIRTILFIPPIGEIRTKTFHENQLLTWASGQVYP